MDWNESFPAIFTQKSKRSCMLLIIFHGVYGGLHNGISTIWEPGAS